MCDALPLFEQTDTALGMIIGLFYFDRAAILMPSSKIASSACLLLTFSALTKSNKTLPKFSGRSLNLTKQASKANNILVYITFMTGSLIIINHQLPHLTHV